MCDKLNVRIDILGILKKLAVIYKSSKFVKLQTDLCEAKYQHKVKEIKKTETVRQEIRETVIKRYC